MRKMMIIAVTASVVAISGVAAQQPSPLSAYVDANGFLDVQALT
jgi:hypothetical protein